MKTLVTATALSLSMLAGAQAADLGQEPTRAQVQAELAQAKANGQYMVGEEGYPFLPAATSSATVDQVRAELAQAKAAGLVTYGNLDYPPQAAIPASHVSRAQVQAELQSAKEQGLVTYGNLDYPPRS
ncbi:DUF4148 domain-containing protein [Bordetella sp. 2513F-2]